MISAIQNSQAVVIYYVIAQQRAYFLVQADGNPDYTVKEISCRNAVHASLFCLEPLPITFQF